MRAQVLGLEARAKHGMYRRQNNTVDDYTGITFYAPNINLARDPRWGRIQEVGGGDEDDSRARGQTGCVLASSVHRHRAGLLAS